MASKYLTWRLGVAAAALVLGAAGVTYASLCPRGFVRFSEYPDAGRFSCIEYGGISSREHYLNLNNHGRMALFGGPFAGEGGHPFLMRTGGDAGKWICGESTAATFALNEGAASIKNVSTILDEATVPRNGNLTLSGLGGGVFGDGCKVGRLAARGNVLQVELETSSAGGGANQEATRLDLRVSGKGLVIATQVDLAAPWPRRGDVEREVTYAWVRLTEVIDGRVIRRIAVAGAGSRLTRKDGCATLELAQVTPLATCPAEGEATGTLEVSW